MCGSSWDSCLAQGMLKPGSFLLLSLIRPFLFTPVMILAWIGGESFGTFWGALLTSLGCVLSAALLFVPSKILGRRYIKPWIASNLPSTFRLLRTQDYKFVVLLRMIPLLPFDLATILFGVADFRTRETLLWTAITVLPEAFIFARFTGHPEAGAISHAVTTIVTLCITIFIPLLVYEILARRSGQSLWSRLLGAYKELLEELKMNNDIVKRGTYSNTKTPVILLYGFFSSRRSLNVLERMLHARGFQVMSFNLGGLFGVFFTKGIEETARFIDEKIKRQIDRYQFKNIHIVGHSKGGLVALWWMTKLGGSKYCNKVITMGSPFRGTWLTYLALVTPLGFFWRDVWQMRPGSSFLKELNRVMVPDGAKLYCLHSERDRVCVGNNGLFRPEKTTVNIVSVPMNHVSHFEFLYRRDVGDTLSILLNKQNQESEESKLATAESSS